MGLLDFLSSAGTVATNAAAAHEAGLRQAGQQETADLLQKIQLARQANTDAMNKQLHEAQIKNYDSLAAERLKPPAPKASRRQDVTLDIGGKPAAGSYDPDEDAYYYQGQKVTNPQKFVSADPMTRFFEGQRQEQDQREAAAWQRHYDRFVTPQYTKYNTVVEGTGLSPAEAAAKADEIYGSRPRLAPKIASQGSSSAPPMGTGYTPARKP